MRMYDDTLRDANNDDLWLMPMTHITIRRWGKDLALRVPTDIASEIGLHEGDQVEVETDDGVITIRRSQPSRTLDQLFSGRSVDEWRAFYAGAYDWGADVGREIIEE